jgi:HEAT repeat protein
VLADPGMGKSTLLRREAGLTAQEERQSLKNNTKTLEEVVFPLFLRLSDLAETPEEIIDAIPALIQRECSETAAEVMELLREKLKVGKCLLLFDALDEVPTEYRKRLFEKLNRFAQRQPPCPIICTSRIVGYSGAFVAGAKEVEIVPFSQKQIEEYIETWFRNAAGYLNDDTVSASSLIRELRNKPQIRGLAQNPLLLSLICSLYQEKGLTLPARRCQVYEQAVRYMLGKWSKNRNPELNDAWIDAKTELLEELAYQFSCDGKEIFTLRELRKTIDEYLRSGNASTDFDNLNASQLISELSEQDGILQRLHKDSDQYLFLHRTFQEYLTACYLNRARDSITLAREHFWKYDWHETLSLLVGLMENPVPLLQAIIDEKDDIFSTLLLLVGRCIAEYEYPEASNFLIVGIINRIYQLWCSNQFVDSIHSTVVALGQGSLHMMERLQTALKDKFIREQAVEALAKIGSPQAVKALTSVLNNEKSDGRFHVAMVLGELGNSQGIQTLITALDNEDANVKVWAAEALERIGNPQGMKALMSFLNHENGNDGNVRLRSVEVLEEIGSSHAVEALILALNDKESYVRVRAVIALEKIGDPEGLKALTSTLKDEDSHARFHAAMTLRKSGNSQAVEVLTSALKNENLFDRGEAAVVLGEIGNPKAVPALISALNDEDSNVRVRAAWPLYNIGSPEGLEALISALKDEEPYFRRWAAVALGEIGDSQAEEALIFALKDNDSNVRLEAAKALCKIGSPQGDQALISALSEENSDTRIEAAKALEKIGIPQGFPVLISALNDKNSYVRVEAAEALGEIGSPQAAQALISALKDEDSKVKLQALSALGEIGNPQEMEEPLISALSDEDWNVKEKAASLLEKIGTPKALKKLIQLSEIDIYDPYIFPLARTLAVRFSKEKLPLIPVYPELVAHKQ